MDSTEDLSARVLLKHILNVETPRTPLTRSVEGRLSAPRRSGRLNKHGALTPQAMLRRSIKQKMRESISSTTRSSKRRIASTVLKQTPGAASMIIDDGDTPRQILKNILLTEPVKSPVVNEHVESHEPQPSPDSSLQSRRPSIELSGLELSDLPIGNIETSVKRLNRKRPHCSLNVTAFEKRLKEANDLAEEPSLQDHSSLSLSNSTSLSLKTPFNDHTERKALQRKILNRRKVSEEDFGAAIVKREMGNEHGTSIPAPGRVLSETAYSESITLALSKISEPDITTDFVNCNNEADNKTDGIMLNDSTLATQDKQTIMASQIQRDLREMPDLNEQHCSFRMEENTVTDVQDRSQCLFTHIDNAAKEVGIAPCQYEQEKSRTGCLFVEDEPEGSSNIQNVDVHNSVKAKFPTENYFGQENPAESAEEADIETENQSGIDEPKTEDPATEQPSHQEACLNLTFEKERTDSRINEDENVEDNEEEVEDAVIDESGEEEELEQTDMKGAEEDEEELDNAVGDSESDKVVHSDAQDEDDNSEHIVQRAACAEDEVIVPIQNNDADLLNDSIPEDYEDILQTSNHKDASEVEADHNENKQNTFQGSGPPEEIEQMEQSKEESVEEEEDDDHDDFPGKTPAFVKLKKNFFHSDPQASPFTSKYIQPGDAGPRPKSKQKAQRKLRSPKSEPCLPKSYLMKVFKHFAKTNVSADVYPVLKDIMDKFCERLSKDLEAYALHARRSTIGVADCELLLRRQGHVNDKVPVEVLIEKYLRMDQRKLLIPIATSGNVVFPKKL